MTDLETQIIEDSQETTAEPVEETRDILAAEFDKIDDGEQQAEQQETEQVTEQPDVKPVDLSVLGYNKEEIAILEQLPDEVKQALSARNERYHSGLKGIKDRAAIADAFTRPLEPFQEYLTALNVAPSDFIPALVQTEQVLRLGSQEQKAAMIQQLAHDYGIDLGIAAQQPFDPNLYQLQKQRDSLQRQLQQSQQSQQIASEQELISSIEQWAADKEHFQAVREDMALLIEGGKAKNLDDAYSKAIRLNDDVFQQVQAKQLEQSKKSQLLQANHAAKLAKAAAVQVKGSPSGSEALPELKDTSDAVRYAMQRHGF